jgi:drug/metabolite transporter (DMT)-like permease
VGLFWGLLSPLGYTATYLCLRAAAVQVDPLVAAFFRSVPLLVAAWTMLLRQRQVGSAGITAWPGWRAIWPLIAVGLIFNVSGNATFQAALGIAGLTISAPVSGGAVLWGSALGGWWLLRERITLVPALGLLLLLASLPLLTTGGGGGTGPVWLGAIAAAVAGLSFGGGNVIMRHTVMRRGFSQGLMLAPITTTGLLSLLVLILARHGLSAFAGLDAPTLGWLLVAGCFNVVGLVSVSRALALLPAARVGALGVLQTGLSSAGGILLFSEPLNPAVGIGLLLSLIGAILSQRRRRPSPAALSGSDPAITAGKDRQPDT